MSRIFLYTIIISCFLFFAGCHKEAPGEFADNAGWSPSAEQISAEVAAQKGSKVQHQEQFARLFQDRYRHHQPMLAIGVRFTHTKKGERLKLMLPARMEPWNIDRLAFELRKESRDTLGEEFPIDIFETYIGSPPLKIGALTGSSTDPGGVTIAYVTRPWQPQVEMGNKSGIYTGPIISVHDMGRSR